MVREHLDFETAKHQLLQILESFDLIYHTNQCSFTWQVVVGSKIKAEGQLRLAALKTRKRKQDGRR